MKLDINNLKQKTNKVLDKSKDAFVVAKGNVVEKTNKLAKKTQDIEFY